jgi:hypothetical protein
VLIVGVFQFDGVAASRTEFPMFFPMQPVLNIQAQKVLFDEKQVNEVLPKVEVVHIWCTRTQWYCVYGMMETERQHKECLKQGKKVRPIRFVEIEGANHLVSQVYPYPCDSHLNDSQVHWDEPEKFWVATVNVINE